MAGRIRDEDIALVRERSAIDEVVGEYLQLRNAGGGSLKGLCPFHDEKTPSFNVTPARGLWYCFSCAEGGDVIRFVQRIDSLSFAEAIERLAARAGIELRYEQGGRVPGQEQTQRRRLIEAHRAAAKFYTERLASADAAPARAFLSERGFETADTERFGTGYAPADWDALTRHLRGRGFTDAELLLGGLASQGRRGAVDRFRGRLIWPIRDLTGEVIAFGARKLVAGDDGPKYLNTPETPLFRKSSVLYGADMARRDIAQRRQAVIVEGYTDVMACHLAGITTAVATSGTSFGEGHITILRRLLMDDSQFRGEVIFTFDGDAAGKKAALRAFGMEEKFVTQTFVAIQPDGLDPCDLRLKQGNAAVRDLIARRVPLYEFAVRSALSEHDLDTAEGRLAALDDAALIVARIKDRGLRKVYAGNLDRWLGLMDQELVLSRINDRVSASGQRGSGQRGPGSGRRPGAASQQGPAAGWPGSARTRRDGALAGSQGTDSRAGSSAGQDPGSWGGSAAGQDPGSWAGSAAGRTAGPQAGPAGGQAPGSTAGPGGQASDSAAGVTGGQAPDSLAGTAGRQAAGPQNGNAGRPTAGAQGGGAGWQSLGLRPGSTYDLSDPVANLERQALKLAVQRPGLCGPAFDTLGPDEFTVGVHAAMRELIAACGGVTIAGPPREWAERLRNAAPSDSARAFVTRLAVEPVQAPGVDGEPDARYVDGVLARLEELAISRQIAVVKSRLQRMSPVDEQVKYNRLFGDLVALEERRKPLMKRAAGAI